MNHLPLCGDDSVLNCYIHLQLCAIGQLPVCFHLDTAFAYVESPTNGHDVLLFFTLPWSVGSQVEGTNATTRSFFSHAFQITVTHKCSSLTSITHANAGFVNYILFPLIQASRRGCKCFFRAIFRVGSLAQAKCFMLFCILVVTLCEGYSMKRKLIFAAILCLFLQSGCYVSTNLKVKNRQLPADFSAPVLVITLQEKTNLGQEYLTLLEQGILQALTEKGINSVTLNQAADKSEQDSTTELLLQNDYRALLKIVIDSWGSRSEVLQDPVPPSVESIQTDRDSSFYPPGAI